MRREASALRPTKIEPSPATRTSALPPSQIARSQTPSRRGRQSTSVRCSSRVASIPVDSPTPGERGDHSSPTTSSPPNRHEPRAAAMEKLHATPSGLEGCWAPGSGGPAAFPRRRLTSSRARCAAQARRVCPTCSHLCGHLPSAERPPRRRTARRAPPAPTGRRECPFRAGPWRTLRLSRLPR